MELMQCALTWGVLCHGTHQRTSSSAPAMVPNTTTKAVSSEAPLLWYSFIFNNLYITQYNI
jgi:hypothetical protein